MRFDWPLALAALAVLPRDGCAVRRPRSPARRFAGGVRQPRPASERRRPQPGTLAIPPAADAARRARIHDRRRRASARHGERSARGSDHRARARRVAIDEGDGRRADTSRRCPCRSEDVPGRGAGEVPRRRRVVRDTRRRRGRADAGSGARDDRARHAQARRGHGHRRRRRALRPGRAAAGRGCAGTAARDRADLRRRPGRRPHRSVRGCTAGQAARNPGLHGARRNRRRRRRGGADRWLQADHAGAARIRRRWSRWRKSRAESSSPLPMQKG